MTDPAQRTVVAIIPAWNEEHTIPRVVTAIAPAVGAVLVVDNGSTDATAEVARGAGAIVVRESRRGYGFACMRGIAEARALHAGIVVFLDGDASDDPADLALLLDPILSDTADLVIGSRVVRAEPGALLPQARAGNWIATRLLRLRWGVRFSDLGPFRAITLPALERLGMRDGTYGWTVEMQIRAARAGLRCAEVPVHYRRRAAGKSKVTGTFGGTVMASAKILGTIARHALRRP